MQGENQPFDFILYCKRSGRFYRTQVKSSTRKWYDGYTVGPKRSIGRRYAARQIDFIAAYVIPEDVWYIIDPFLGLKSEPKEPRNRVPQRGNPVIS